jgi:hypothetical protein
MKAAFAALVAPEPVAQRLECGDDQIRVGPGRQADRDVQDRLGGQSGHGGGADVLDGDGVVAPNFFERRVSAYQVAVPGEVNLEEAFCAGRRAGPTPSPGSPRWGVRPRRHLDQAPG